MAAAEHEALARDDEARLAVFVPSVSDTLIAAEADPVGDDLLRLIFTACHPVLTRDAQLALTLKLVARAEHRRDRAGLPGQRGDDRAAHRARQAQPRRSPRALRTAAARATGRASGRGARGRLPDLQRRLRRNQRRRLDAPGAVRRSAAPGTHVVGAGAGRTRSPWPAGAAGDPGLALGGACRWRRPTDPADGPGPHALGSAADPPRPGRARAGRGAGRGSRARPLRAAGRARRLPRARRSAPKTPTGTPSARSTTRCSRCSPRRWSNSTVRWRSAARAARLRRCRWCRRWRRCRNSRSTTCCPA